MWYDDIQELLLSDRFWFVSFASGMVSNAVFVRLVNRSSGRILVIVIIFVIALCSVVILDMQRHPNVLSQYLSNVVPHMHFLLWLRMGSRSLHSISSVNDFSCAIGLRRVHFVVSCVVQ